MNDGANAQTNATSAASTLAGSQRGTAGTEAAAAATGQVARHNLIFELERNIRYHHRRIAHLERCQRVLDFSLLIAGSAIIGEIAGKVGADWTLTPLQWIGVFVAVVAGLQTVWQPGTRAGEHKTLLAQFVTLRGRAKLCPPADLDGVDVDRLALENTEPPVFWWLEADTYDEVCRQMRVAPADFRSLPFWKRLMMHWFHGSPAPLPRP